MPAIKVHHTKVDTDTPFDGPKFEARIPNGDEKALKKYNAWVDPDKDPTTKAAYKFGHHLVDEDGKVGAASYKGCTVGIAELNGARGGADIPDADRQAVWDHFAAHIKDAGEDPPELKKRNAELKPASEMRSFNMPDLRAAATEEGGNIIEGHAAVIGQTATIGGWFKEIVEPGAFDRTDFTDVLMSTINHDLRIPLARSRNNNKNSTLQLQVDNQGLAIRAVLDTENNGDARAVYSAVSRGDISGMSYIFSVRGETWDDLDSDMPTRHITDIAKVYEVSPVSMPAYTGTDINARDQRALDSAARALESARSELESSENERREKERQERERLQQEEARKTELDLLRMRAEILAKG